MLDIDIPKVGEIADSSARIAVAKRVQHTLRGLLVELDQTDLQLAAIHVNAAVEQLSSDLASITACND